MSRVTLRGRCTCFTVGGEGRGDGGGGGVTKTAHLRERYYLVRASHALFRQAVHVKGLAVEVEGHYGALATAHSEKVKG